jgi:hypothetical protein
MRPRRPKAAGESTLLLLQVIEVLDRERVDHMLVGAMAAAVHGVIRATTDADLLIGVAVPRLHALRARLQQAGFEVAIRRGDADDPIGAMLVITDKFGNRVELMSGIRGMDPQAFGRGATIEFEGVSLRVVGLEDFIAMKCFAGGPVDVEDARQVLHLAPRPINLDLLRRLVRRFGRDSADALETLLG